MIVLFVEGTLNVLKHHGVVPGPLGRTGADVGIYIGDSAFPILASTGGVVEMQVRLDDMVTAGQKVAIQRNAFGELVATDVSAVAGKVAAFRSDATAEPGQVLMFILFNSPGDEVGAYPE